MNRKIIMGLMALAVMIPLAAGCEQDPQDPQAQLEKGLAADSARDYSEAARLYRKAAEQGLASAQIQLAHSYRVGSGVGKDDREAARWFLKAAEQGHTLALFNLGKMYNKDEDIPRDVVQAYKWFHLSFRVLRSVANRDLLEEVFFLGSKEELKILEKEMRKAEITKARAEAAAWLKAHK